MAQTPPKPPTRATMILAQAFISLLMAFLMTAIFTAFPMHFEPGWIWVWLTRFVRAWPIAFALSLIVGPLSFRMANMVMRWVERRATLA